MPAVTPERLERATTYSAEVRAEARQDSPEHPSEVRKEAVYRAALEILQDKKICPLCGAGKTPSHEPEADTHHAAQHKPSHSEVLNELDCSIDDAIAANPDHLDQTTEEGTDDLEGELDRVFFYSLKALPPQDPDQASLVLQDLDDDTEAPARLPEDSSAWWYVERLGESLDALLPMARAWSTVAHTAGGPRSDAFIEDPDHPGKRILPEILEAETVLYQSRLTLEDDASEFARPSGLDGIDDSYFREEHDDNTDEEEDLGDPLLTAAKAYVDAEMSVRALKIVGLEPDAGRQAEIGAARQHLIELSHGN